MSEFNNQQHNHRPAVAPLAPCQRGKIKLWGGGPQQATIRIMAQLRRAILAGDVSAVSGLVKDPEQLNLPVPDVWARLETALICAARQLGLICHGHQVHLFATASAPAMSPAARVPAACRPRRGNGFNLKPLPLTKHCDSPLCSAQDQEAVSRAAAVLQLVVAAPGVDFDTVDARGETALHLAATWRMTHPDVLTVFNRLLVSSIAAGVDLNHCTGRGESALHLAIRAASAGSQVARRLVAAGADLK